MQVHKAQATLAGLEAKVPFRLSSSVEIQSRRPVKTLQTKFQGHGTYCSVVSLTSLFWELLFPLQLHTTSTKHVDKLNSLDCRVYYYL
jgi:hypothetical protein